MAYAYANQPQNRATAIVAVAGIHAGIGALLIYGLATGGFAPPEIPDLTAGQIAIEPPPPPPEPTPEPSTAPDTSSRQVVAPVPPLPIPSTGPKIDTTQIILPPTPPAPRPLPRVTPTLAPPAPPAPTPTLDPVAARPSNNPGGWVTQNDYRSSWVSRGYTGEVGFRLSVGASGRVESCSVTRSSGVSALDQATCQLVTRRARFDPAKNGQGRAVPGSYSNAVRWQLPD